MGLFSSKQKSSSNSTQQTSAWSPVQGALESGAGLMSQYLSSPSSTAVYSGPRVANLSGDTQAGLNMMRQSQGANDAYGFFKDIMTGGAGTSNPQVAAMQDVIRRQVMGNVAAQFSNAGTVGGTVNQEVLSRGLADGLAQPLFAAYESDMARKIQAGQALPGLDQTRIQNMMGAGQVRDSYAQSKIDADRKKFEEERTAPMKAWSEIFPYASGLGQMFGTTTQNSTNTSKSTPGIGSQILGGLMTAAGVASGMPALGGLFGGGAAAGASAPWVTSVFKEA